MNRILLSAVILIGFSHNSSAQDYISFNDGHGYFAHVTSVNDSTIAFETTRTKNYSLKEIKLIEYEEKGVVIYTPNAIKKAPTRPDGYFGKDCRVYIPFSSTKVKQRECGIALRKILKDQDYWTIVDCEDESNLIIEPIIDETNEDMIQVRVTDSSDKDYYLSPKIKAWANLNGFIFGGSAHPIDDMTSTGIGNKLAWSLKYCIDEFQNEHNPDIPMLDLTNYTTNLLAKGNSVFVRVGGETEDIYGANSIIDLLKQDGFWRLVSCPKEAHFILEFKFSDEGRDHANIFLKRRDGSLIKMSSNVGCDDGEEATKAGKKLYNSFIKSIQKEVVKGK
jgi:hypothetical protein